MLASGQFFTEKMDEYLLLGELALDGRVRPVKGALATAMLALRLRSGQGPEIRGVIVPADNASEAAVVDGADVIGVNFLSDVVGFLTDELLVLSPAEGPVEPHVVDLDEVFAVAGKYDVDFSDVRGRPPQSACGGIGPPGSGKTVYAGRFPFRRSYRRNARWRCGGPDYRKSKGIRDMREPPSGNGRASRCQRECREFKSHRPLSLTKAPPGDMRCQEASFVDNSATAKVIRDHGREVGILPIPAIRDIR